MLRQLLTTLSAFLAATLMVVAAAGPAIASPHYQAQPAVSPAKAKLVLRDVVWNCGDAGCAAEKSGSRPAIVCAHLAKEVGALRTFSVKGGPLAAGDLEKCNARAE